jgi:hypothetical protein
MKSTVDEFIERISGEVGDSLRVLLEDYKNGIIDKKILWKRFNHFARITTQMALRNIEVQAGSLKSANGGSDAEKSI